MGTTSSGRKGEQLAASYLKRKGYEVLENNYRRTHGEVDIIAKDGETLVFVEVKSRKNKMCIRDRRMVDRLAQNGAPNRALKTSYKELLDAVESCSDKALKRAIRTAVEEKSRYVAAVSYTHLDV